MRKDLKNINDLRDNLSFLLHKLNNLKELEKKKEELLRLLQEHLESEKIDSEKLVYIGDQLSEIGYHEIKNNRRLQGILSLISALVAYKLANDIESASKSYKLLSNILANLENEALSWREWDAAFIIHIIYMISEGVFREKEKEKPVKYLKNVHPLLIELANMVNNLVKESCQVTVLEDIVKRTEEIAKKYGFENIWHTFKDILNLFIVFRTKKCDEGSGHGSNDEENAKI
ncbi:MAG: hypothetical protein ACTSVA_09225 [Candidatus Njordarchaeales archaeon]